ncbi:37S ribosomal protein S22 [Puccinia graminis f. sp. tritici]|uniref:37S ribosomal protein S22 n=2 Tax=Puccinia graminis f. sp. tritici TaxID=56615 RepID=E3K969_PUCGT|nr:uncharacterized protein PGTG_07096 [Puccinia graminis f. sp. tritici CRL 75-36-700-3]XP_003890042.1 hypothetical protein, variant [Puccinia graminis f. sp. tritici CRL 75-36-700-3]EFP80844.2 hypothetical protein PGTG_07096 [Puccinia graminis f. sp. tritici CRL 75-36-700-3]EHS62959.1 hypothetical protein, variant [Puccinia graminis f. sp. tritici CRL 75-36-700-3]KAA1068767.1 37S ribosomal protein S22 [Puccinia graminis f. sp. tritici]
MVILTARTVFPSTKSPIARRTSGWIHRSTCLPTRTRLVHQPAALSRFLDDLSAHSDQTAEQQDVDLYQNESDGVSRRSNASEYGSTRQSIIKLPTELVTGVQELIQSVSHRSTIRTNALGLYGKYRLTSSKESLNMSNNDLMDTFFSEKTTEDGKKFVKPKLRTTYDHLTSISFAAGAMPSAYGATLKVLLELKRRLNSDRIRRSLESEWTPKTLVDYGSGTGSALWAALEVWPDSLKEYTGLDKSSSMIWLNETLLKKRSNRPFLGQEASDLKASFRRITISPTQAERLKHATTTSTDWLNQIEKEEAKEKRPEIELEPSKFDWTGDSDGLLAIMSFTLSDLPNQAARREAIEGMWNSGAETMVIIDRGTPAGFQVVADARQQLLMLGRRQLRRARYEREVAISSENNEDEYPDNSAALGSWVLAPCPHDKPCPLHLSDNPKHFCHFSQRIERPKFLKDTKHTTRHEEDAKFSYVVIRRGQRPPSASLSSDLAGSSRETVPKPADDDNGNSSSGAALEWPRIILPPHKCKGHVIFDVCAVSGEIERLTVPRSQGKQAYYDARKTFWGDSWPHGSKNPAIVKDLQGRNGNRGDRRRKKKELNVEFDD